MHGLIAETYIELMTDKAHLMFEITLTIIQDVVIGLVLWPLAKKWLKNHDARKHQNDCNHDQGELF